MVLTMSKHGENLVYVLSGYLKRRQNRNFLTINKFFGNVSKFEYLETTETKTALTYQIKAD